jgi:predicted PurR-regulated permease PerM
MGYKLLGYIVWQVGKWYARRRAREARPRIAAAVVVALVLAGVLAGARQRAASNP